MDQDATWYGARPQLRGLCFALDGDPARHLNFRPMFIIVIVSCRTRVKSLYARFTICVLVIIEFGLNILGNPVTLLTLFVLKIDCRMFKVTVTVTFLKTS